MRHIRASLMLLLITSVVTGILYPLSLVVVGRALFPRQAEGSLIMRQGTVVGSTLLGQSFTANKYFHGRPSAAGNGYDAMASAASNLSQGDSNFVAQIAKRVEFLKKEHDAVGRIPVDFVTASASGLDPDISIDAAKLQAARIAKERGVEVQVINSLIAQRIKGQELGLLGSPRINVLELNIALDDLNKGAP